MNLILKSTKQDVGFNPSQNIGLVECRSINDALMKVEAKKSLKVTTWTGYSWGRLDGWSGTSTMLCD